MARTWTDEQKATQAALIRSWKPWQKSTGPRTAAGKATASGNASLGMERKQEAIEQARRELRAAQVKLFELTRPRKDKWRL